MQKQVSLSGFSFSFAEKCFRLRYWSIICRVIIQKIATGIYRSHQAAFDSRRLIRPHAGRAAELVRLSGESVPGEYLQRVRSTMKHNGFEKSFFHILFIFFFFLIAKVSMRKWKVTPKRSNRMLRQKYIGMASKIYIYKRPSWDNKKDLNRPISHHQNRKDLKSAIAEYHKLLEVTIWELYRMEVLMHE